MKKRACLLILLFAIGVLAFVPSSDTSAQVLGPGCRKATAQDQDEMEARGIPRSFQICPKEEQILGIGRDFEQWYAQLKTQSPCNRDNKRVLAYRTRNTGAQVCGTTSRRWNAIGCHPNNNTAIFPTVSHGFAAHIELLRRYCGERGRCTIGRVVQQWTATVGDRPAYANFVSRNSGMPINRVFDPNDIDLVGRIALAMSCFEAGSMPFDVNDLKEGLIMAGGGKRVPVPSNVGALLNESLTGNYQTNPNGFPTSHPGSWPYPPSSISSGSYTPPTPPSTPQPISQPTPQAVPLHQGTSTAQTSSSDSESIVSRLMNAVRGDDGEETIIAGPPVAFMHIQPRTVPEAGRVLISWTSVNMRANTCSVTEENGVIGKGNEGSILIKASDFGTGELKLEFRCQAPDGTIYVQEDAVTIE